MNNITEYAVFERNRNPLYGQALVKTRTGRDRTGVDQTGNQTEVVNKNVNYLPRASRSFGSKRYLE